jgi:hypothetical protein
MNEKKTKHPSRQGAARPVLERNLQIQLLEVENKGNYKSCKSE